MPTSKTYDKRHSVTSVLTAAVAANRFVSFDGAHATSGGSVEGVSEQAGASGSVISLITAYSAPVTAGAVIAAGDPVGPSSDGSGMAVPNAANGNCGTARTAAAVGELVEVAIGRGGVALPQGIAKRVSRTAIQRMGVAGDSIAAQASNPATYNQYAAGAVNWMLARLGFPWWLPPSGNFAVGGTTTDVMVATQLPAIVAANRLTPFTKMFWSAGTNDTNALRPIADIKANLQRLFEGCLDNGIQPVWWGVLPRGNDGAMTAAKRMNLALNDWGRWFAYTRGGLEFIDIGPALANNATAFGNALAALTDGTQLHPIDPGGFYLGRALADFYQSRGIGPGLQFATSQADVYDATNNPQGVIFDAPNPLLQGGATAPTGMTTSGGVWSKGAIALPNGQSQATADCALAAGATHYLYDDALASGAWDVESLREGMSVYATAKIKLTGVADLRQCYLRVSENNGVNAQVSAFLSPGATGQITPEASLTLYMMTMPQPIRAYGGSGNASIFARLDTVTGPAGAGNISISQFELRQWPGEL